MSSIRLMNSGRKFCLHDLHHRGLHLRVVALARELLDHAAMPRFEVITITVLRKSTVRPCPSVSRPSSSTCSSTLNTSGCAFSTSSSRITAVRPAAHRLGEIAAFLVTDVARRRADQPRDRVLLHELGHVDAHHRLFGVEQELGERLAQLGLADAGGTQEQERAVRPVRIGQPGARAADRIRDDRARPRPGRRRAWRSASSMRSSFSFSPSSIFETGMPVHFETTSAISSSVTLLRTQLGVLALGLLRLGERFSSSGIWPYWSSATAPRSAGAARRLDLEPCTRSSSSLMCVAPCSVAFSAFQISSRSAYSFSSFAICSSRSARRCFDASSLLLLQRLALDLELDDAALEPVHLLGLGVDLHADARRGLVDQVDRLVGQLAVAM